MFQLDRSVTLITLILNGHQPYIALLGQSMGLFADQMAVAASDAIRSAMS